jgi:HK97 family phage portal protein
MILDRLLEARMTTVSAGTLQEPQATLLESLGATPTAAGVTVNERSAEGIPAVFACVRVIAETVGQVSLKVYQKLAKGNKEPDETHPLYVLLHDLANPECTAQEFRENLTGHAALWGNAFAEVERRKSGTIKALWPLHPGCMRVDRGNDNRLRYTYSNPETNKETVYHWDPIATPIFHLRYNGGRSPIRVLREALATSRALDIFAAALFGNGARPGGVLQSKEAIKITQKQIDAIRLQWNELHRGVGNSHKIAVLPPGLQWQAVGMPLEDAQFAELLKLQIEQAARIWRVPLFMIQSMEKTSSWGTGIESMSIGFKNFTMMPWFIRWQQTIARDLLTYKSFETHEALFRVASLLQADTAALNAALKVQREMGIINGDEWRELIDLNAQPNGQGSIYWRPANIVPADTPVLQPPDPAVRPLRDAVTQLENRVEQLRQQPAPAITVNAPITVEPSPVTIADGALRVEHHAAAIHVDAPVTIADGAIRVDARTDIDVPAPTPMRRTVTKRDQHGRADETEETPIETRAE